MIKKLIPMIMLVSSTPLVHTQASDNIQTSGNIGFYGSSNYSKHKKENKYPVYDPKNKDNPYYDGVNTVGSKPILPDTGSTPIYKVLITPVVLLSIAVVIFSVHKKNIRNFKEQV